MVASENRIVITVDGKSMSATLADNQATKTLIDRLSSGAITITMSNYGGFEKVGSLPWSLPSSDTQITTKPGDIMLYNSNQMVIFYGQNSWAYTPLGVLENTDSDKIRDFVGNGDKQVTISLDSQTQIKTVALEDISHEKVFNLEGIEIKGSPLTPGLYIVNNKKVFIK